MFGMGPKIDPRKLRGWNFDQHHQYNRTVYPVVMQTESRGHEQVAHQLVHELFSSPSSLETALQWFAMRPNCPTIFPELTKQSHIFLENFLIHRGLGTRC